MKQISKRRVMVAEKDEVVRATLTDYLDTIGCEVAVCGSRDELLAGIAGQSFDAIILGDDVDSADGSRLVGELAEAEVPSGIVVIVAYRSLDQVLEMYRRGAVDVIIRPCQYHELDRSLDRAFRRHRQNLICHFFEGHKEEVCKLAGAADLEWDSQPQGTVA